MFPKCLSVLLLMLLTVEVYCYNNGVARTPPMGFLSWGRFRCVTDCVNFPDSCVSEKLYMEMADRLHEDGWIDHGYYMVNIDDCWMYPNRTATNQLQPDPKRFPSGIKALADYVHKKGAKLGIYADMGTKTCTGSPGSMGYEKIDAQTFADWGIDMLKLDGCNSNFSQQAVGYPLMSKELNATGRHIIFSCSWPANFGGLPPKINYTLLGEICNMWRNYGDIGDSFVDVTNIMEWYAENQDALIPAAGPGRWNDPDMLIGGDFSLSFDEARLQFGIWAMLAAPLLVSVDLRTIDPRIREEIYFNRKVIDVNQDPLGIQGRRVKAGNRQELWAKPLIGGEYAIAVIDINNYGVPLVYTFSMNDLGIEKPAKRYLLVDIYDDDNPRLYSFNELIHTLVNPHGIRMYRAIPDYRESVSEIDIAVIDIL